jgi:succinate dehydrogenase / fumarate reductase flavoprotein subunit
MSLDAKIPSGPLAQKWDKHKLRDEAGQSGEQAEVRGHRRRGRARRAPRPRPRWPSSATGEAASCFHDSPRRAHSIAAQGGINAAKNYQNDGDSVYRLFYDTIKGGDFRAREANVHRLAEVSVNIIDQCVAQGVPFAREYGGLLANRSFGGAQVSRTFYARGQTGQQLLLGAYQALSRQIGLRRREDVHRAPRCSTSWWSAATPRASSCATWSRVKFPRHAADAVVLATGGYGNVFNLSTYARGCNVTAIWRAYKRGACFANPCFTQIHPTCIPVTGDTSRS